MRVARLRLLLGATVASAATVTMLLTATAGALSAPPATSAPLTATNQAQRDPLFAPRAATDIRRTPGRALISGVPLSRPSTARGAGKAGGYECTSGLPATKQGRQFIIVAGHCGARGEQVYTAWSQGRRASVGTVRGVSAQYDIAAIETSKPVAARVWALRGKVTKQVPIRGIADAVPGSTVCQYGYRSGTVCGITVQPVTSKQRAAGLVFGKAPRGRAAALPGDSGAVVMDLQGRAVGIVSQSTPDGQWVGWVPARLALKNWNLSVK